MEHLAHRNAAPPLTEREKELEKIKLMQATPMNMERKSHMTGLGFQVTESLKAAMEQLYNPKGLEANEFAVSVAVSNESFELLKSTKIENQANLKAQFDDTIPQFILYAHQEKLGLLTDFPLTRRFYLHLSSKSRY